VQSRRQQLLYGCIFRQMVALEILFLLRQNETGEVFCRAPELRHAAKWGLIREAAEMS
jgi:hypothetical protein